MRASALGAKLRNQTMTARAVIERNGPDGFAVLASDVPCDVEDRTPGAFDADPHGATTDRVGIWKVGFRLGRDVLQSDLLTITLRGGTVLPKLTVSHPIADDFGDAREVIAVSEASAVAREWVTFKRYNQDANTTTLVGTYAVEVAWDRSQPRDVTVPGLRATYVLCTLTGLEPFPVYTGDYVDEVEGRNGGTVTEAREPVAGRKEVRARFDIGGS